MSPTVLALFGFGMVIAFMVLIMTKRMSALASLIVIPIAVAAIAGFGPEIGSMGIKGVVALAPTAAVLLFAVLYFGVMIDAGLFDPLVRRVLKAVGGDPRKVALGTAIVALIVSLDGDGATTAIVTITAFLPIYRRLNMNVLVLAVLLGSANAMINIAPWGGPTARVASALHLDINDVFLPLIPAIAIGIVGVLALAWHLGGVERRRLGVTDVGPETGGFTSLRADAPDLARPRLLWVNLVLTLAVLAGAITRILPLPLIFMVGLAIAVTVNYPRLDDQRARIGAHAANAIGIVILVFAAGVFTGILDGSGMVAAMGGAFVHVIPPEMGPYMGFITALASGPLSFVMSNDAYYFGIVPVIAEAAGHYGVAPVEIARASLLGQTIHNLSPLVAGVYLVAGMLDVELGAMQRFGLKWAALMAALLVFGALITGAVPFVVG
ncbi:citrate:proton symporter [Brevundimonas sp.]|uniref:CitMHS family transporter n=1 Tax=Brevundimonas sp. TaxID=1871086 RepID=UPI00289BF33D|nr:citrate:proton symporter [Brevundimonas sp.]